MRTTIGMVIVGMLAALAGMVFSLILLSVDPLSEPWMLAGRAGSAILAALAFVAAEAILFVRPWFYRAAKTFAVAWFLVAGFGLVLTDGAIGLFETLVMTVLSFTVIGPVMSFLGEKNRLMPRHPRAFVRVPGSRGTP
ncbi:MAG: hypothetical protein JO306_02830 [Gemmatimonadetes bacterium]|nr:hypothetical protein [Gemmatimonadota bacterium]